MSVTTEDLQDSHFAIAPQLNATEAISFKFERMDTAITFTNYLGKEIMFDG